MIRIVPGHRPEEPVHLPAAARRQGARTTRTPQWWWQEKPQPDVNPGGQASEQVFSSERITRHGLSNVLTIE